MAFDGIAVSALVAELSEKLKEGRITKIIQPEADELILTVKTPEGQHRLLLSADASLPLAFLTESNKQAPPNAPGFCMLLRKHLQSGRITAVRQPGLERIIMLDIQHLNEMGDLCSKTLILELMGKHSNIIFCEERSGKLFILDAIKHISGLVSSVREVLPGREYFIPNTMDKMEPLSADITFEEFDEKVLGKPVSAAKALYTSITGFSPLIAQEIVFCAGADGEMPTASLSDIQRDNIFRKYCRIVSEIKNKAFSPEIIYELDSRIEDIPFSAVPKDFSALHLTMFEDKKSQAFSSISLLLETYYSRRNLVTRIRQRSSDLRRVVTTALERNVKKLDLQTRQLKDTEKKDKFRVWGELINAYGYGVESGASSMEALNYYTDETITIPLDPTLTAQENGRKYFDKYQKMKRTQEAVTELIEQTQAEIDHLSSILTSLDIALREEDLVQIRLELEQTGYLKRKVNVKSGPGNKGKNNQKKVRITSKPLHYVSSDGYDMYVGKNNLQNDELTFKFASGGDWWFHAKKLHGSHVIVKNTAPGAGEMPDRVYEEAAALAAYYSQGRDQTLVEVDYLQKKNVKKPGGAKPGFVVYYTNYSLAIAPDISKLRLVE